MICCSVLIEKMKVTILCLYFFIMIRQGTVDLLEAPFWRCRTENIWFKLQTLRSSVTVRLSIHLIQIAFKKNSKSKILCFHKHFEENKDVTNNDSNLERFCSPRNNWVLWLKLQNNNFSGKLLTNFVILILAQTYWSVLKKFMWKSFLYSAFFHENSFITDFREKIELFNSIFANKCSLITNSSVLLGDYELFTVESLSNIIFTDNSIGKSHKGFRLQQSSC